MITSPVKSALAHLCDVFNEGWTPPPKVDPDLLAAREWLGGCQFITYDGLFQEAAMRDAFIAGIKHGRSAPDMPHILLTPAEVQSGHDRVKWAQGLIEQLPGDHDGRNSWLLNYGTGAHGWRANP